MSIDDSELFSCPYCTSDNYLTVDPTGGNRQKLIVDCEICCQPIIIHVVLSGGTILQVNIRKENE
jgi:hypothetical protein